MQIKSFKCHVHHAILSTPVHIRSRMIFAIEYLSHKFMFREGVDFLLMSQESGRAKNLLHVMMKTHFSKGCLIISRNFYV